MKSLDFIGGLVVAFIIAIGMFKVTMWALAKNAAQSKKDSEGN